MNVTTISVEPEVSEIAKGSVRPSNLKSQSSKPADSTASNVPLSKLHPDDINEYRWLSLVSCILCFFIIAPVMAFYHSRRVRKMKENQELARAKRFSERVQNLLIFSMIVGIIIWAAIIFVIVALFIMGAVL